MKASALTEPQYLTIAGKRMVILDEAAYRRLASQADEWEPPMPVQDANGNFPAIEAMRVSLARDIIRHRRRVGLSRQELSRRAGVQLRTVLSIEQAEVSPSPATVAKLQKVLEKLEKK